MTSPVNTEVKFFSSDMPSAPVLSGTAGALTDLLTACLVDGFGSKSVSSLVVAGGIATLTHGGGLSAAQVHGVILVAGATPTALNGEQKVIAVTSTTVQYATAQADTTATGTITFKMAPAGWTRVFTGTNKAAYKSANVAATGAHLRVDDTGTTNARVVGYEAMTDVDTGTGPFPTAAQLSGGAYWAKSSAANTTARPWVLISDGRALYLAMAHYNGLPAPHQTYAFGDVASVKSGDAYSAVLAGSAADESSNIAGSLTANYDRVDGNAVAGACYMARSFSGLGTSIALRRVFATLAMPTTVAYSGAGNVPYPNAADGGLYLLPHYLLENNNLCVRAVSPGYYCSPQALGAATFVTRDKITGVTGITGRTLMAIASNSGASFVDITGPWR